MTERPAIEVLQPGMLSTVQDLGRRGHARFGVAPGGALDRTALTLGNRLLANSPDAPAIEITLIGPELRFACASVIVISGADLGARLNGRAVPLWTPTAIHEGDAITFALGAGDGLGARAYLCVAGGIDVEPVMNGRGTDLAGGFGGFAGRALKAGDQLSIGEPALPAGSIMLRSLRVLPPKPSNEILARVVLGPQADRFTERGISTLLSGEYEVTARSNRQGLRLAGDPIEHASGADMISEGIAHGAVQVPGDGQPIVLLAARQTVGGYVKIATVIGADLDAFGQLRPGNVVRFESVSVEEARAATLAARAAIGEDAVVERLSVVPGSQPSVSSEEVVHVAGAWDPEGVERVLAAIERTGVTAFSLEVAGAGIKISLERGLPVPATTAAQVSKTEDREQSILAPVLGVFYRRSQPDQPPLAEVGARVSSGQAIGVIEVMKTYHEVVSPANGVIASFAMEDGHYVEYGQEIARLVTD